MRHITIIISLLLISTNLFSQKTKKKESTSSWRDTTFIFVALKDTIKDKKIVAVEIGEKATIYVKMKPMIFEAKQNLSDDFVKNYYKKIIHYFDSASRKSDTIFINNYYKLRYFEY